MIPFRIGFYRLPNRICPSHHYHADEESESCKARQNIEGRASMFVVFPLVSTPE